MGRILTAALSTVTVLVLLFSYRTSTEGADASARAVPGVVTQRAGTGSTTVTGPAVDTEWGPVQVELTLGGDTITDVSVLQYPSGNHHDEQINSYALPILVEDTLAAQSADIDMVSGATVTSQGYLGSLQAALDEAHL